MAGMTGVTHQRHAIAGPVRALQRRLDDEVAAARERRGFGEDARHLGRARFLARRFTHRLSRDGWIGNRRGGRRRFVRRRRRALLGRRRIRHRERNAAARSGQVRAATLLIEQLVLDCRA
jgi:hypothetical protein